MNAWAIVAAAGEGRRFGGPKAFAPLAGLPMVAHSLRALAQVEAIRSIVLVVARELVADAPAMLATTMPATPMTIASGAGTRQRSVSAALELVPPDAEVVLVHDAARPLVTPGLISAVLDATAGAAGAIAAVPERDTIKRVAGRSISETVDRDGLWRAQTPQAFRTGVLRHAHELAGDGDDATDDAVLLERIGETVVVVPGDERNIKVTLPEDLAVAEAILEARRLKS